MNDDYPGRYYRAELVKSPPPDFNKQFFEIEKILKTVTKKGKKYHLVKFLFYPPKFNQYIPDENLKN
jgi:hypothetical protein